MTAKRREDKSDEGKGEDEEDDDKCDKQKQY